MISRRAAIILALTVVNFMKEQILTKYTAVLLDFDDKRIKAKEVNALTVIYNGEEITISLAELMTALKGKEK